jgi:Thymidylate synthase
MGEIIESANYIWEWTLRELISATVIPGVESVGRGQTYKGTREIIAYSCGIDMHWPVVANLHRKLSKKFLFGEAYWILTADDRLETIAPYCPPISNFSDNGVTLAGAYGPRIAKQIPYIVNGLRENKNSRQAVLTIWTPNPEKSKDIPCTTSVQFLIRHDSLHLILEMRSSDIWLGWPYDIFNFTMLALYMITLLRPQYNLKLGNIYFRAGSQHLYQENVGQATQCLRGSGEFIKYEPLNEDEFSAPHDVLGWLRRKRDEESTSISFLKELNKTEL